MTEHGGDCKESGGFSTQWRMTRRGFLLGLGVGLGLTRLHAATGIVLNLDSMGLALQGYDPVAYFTVQAAVKGRPEITSQYQGATYRFRSDKNKTAFDAEPARFVPQFGGYCAYGVSKGKLVAIDPEAFQIVDGRLLLQYSKGVRDDFNKDTAGNLRKADAQWPQLVEKKSR